MYVKEAGKRDEGKRSGSQGQLRNKPGDLELGGIQGNCDTRQKSVRSAKMGSSRNGRQKKKKKRYKTDLVGETL